MSTAQWNSSNSTARERQSLLAGPALVEPSRSATVDADFYAPKPPPLRYFCRTWSIGIFFGILALGITGCMYYWYIWLSIGFTIVLPFTVMFLAPVMFSCCYSGVPTTPEWKTTVRRVAMWGLLFGGLAGCIGGYFAREMITIDALTPYNTVSSTAAPLTDLGKTSQFTNGAAPLAYSVGRGTAFGIYPVCVAPILEIPTQKAVSYWAVGTGSCCSPNPATCDSWNTITGATRIYFMELYNNISAATADAISNFNLIADPNAIFVRWGDPVAIKKTLRNNIIWSMSIAGGLGLIFMGWRSYKGPY